MAKNINMLFLISWVLIITLGSFQFGFNITIFNSFTTLMYKQYEYHDEGVIKSQDTFNSVVTTMFPLGAMFGSFTITPFTA